MAPSTRHGSRSTPVLVIGLAVLLAVGGCSSGGSSEIRQPGDESVAPATRPAPRPGSTVVALEFLEAYENERTAFYYPIEGLAGCTFAPDGTLIFCDEKRGKIFGLEPGTHVWYEFDDPPSRPFRPLDVVVDGFKILALDSGSNKVFRFDMNGAWLDQVLDIRQADPSNIPQVTSFALDRDGRMLIADVSQQQVLLLDPFSACRCEWAPPVRSTTSSLIPADSLFSLTAGLSFRTGATAACVTTAAWDFSREPLAGISTWIIPSSCPRG